MSHTKNVLKNTYYSYIYILSIKVVQFVLRTVFIRVLGVEYLGINGLFTNILGILSFADLGIGTVLSVSIYKPLALGDKSKVVTYLNIYRKAYNIVALLIACIGLMIFPFLDLLIKNPGNVGDIKAYYLIYLFNTVVSYYQTYLLCIPRGLEKDYIISKVYTVFNIVIGIIQILVLYITKSFYLFLISQSIMLVIEKTFLANKIKKIFPWVLDNNNNRLDDCEKSDIFKNIKAAIATKLLQTTISSTDNIIISAFLGISVVGYVSNYILISNTFYSLVSQVFNNLTASIGNFIHTKTKREIKIVFDATLFISYVLYSYVSIGFIALVNMFITIWLGRDFVLGNGLELVLGLVIFTNGMKTAYFSFKDAFAVFYDDYLCGLYAAVINIVTSVFFIRVIGLTGVFLGTLLTESFLLFVKPIKSYERIINDKYYNYIITITKYYLNFLINLIIVYFINNILFSSITFWNFLIKILIVSIVFLLYNIIIFHKDNSYVLLKNIIVDKFIKKIYYKGQR